MQTHPEHMPYTWSGQVWICSSLSLSELPDDLKYNSHSFLSNVFLKKYTLEELSKEYVQMVLSHFKGNKKQACEFLNINYRTLQNKL